MEMISGEKKEDKKMMTMMSFEFDNNINLIDILSENDEFLLQDSFQGFRLSGISNPQKQEKIQQKEVNLLPYEFIRPSRPSFLRRSLGWDSAFFDNAGVLDPDELSVINKGFQISENVCELQRSKSVSGDGSWIENESSVHENKSRREAAAAKVQVGMQNAQGGKKFDTTHVKNKVKSNHQTSVGKNLSVHSKEKMQKETTPVRRRAMSSPKTIGRSLSVTRSNNASLPAKSDSRKGSATATPTGSYNRLSSSVSDSKILRKTDSIRKGAIKDLMSSGSSSVGKNKHGSNSSNTNNVEAKPDVEKENMIIRPSGLRPPSPRHCFFEENTPVRSSGTTKSIPRIHSKVFDTRIISRSQDSKRFKRSNTIGASSFLAAETEIHTNSGGICNQTKHPRNNKHVINSSPMDDTTKRDTSKKHKKIRPSSMDHISNLSKQFEVINLNQQDKVQQEIPKGKTDSAQSKRNNKYQIVPTYTFLKQKISQLCPPLATAAYSGPGTRKPLTDKTSKYNSRNESRKERYTFSRINHS